MTIRKTRRLGGNVFKTKTGEEILAVYCRKCMQTKKPTEFYETCDPFLDTNSKLSICKDCINSIYDKIYQNEHSNEKTTLRICRMLNIKFDVDVVRQTEKYLEELSQKRDLLESKRTFFSVYKSRIHKVGKGQALKEIGTFDLTFREPNNVSFDNSKEESLLEENTDFNTKEYLCKFWGKGLTFDDYQYLEQEFAEWKRTTKCDTQSELILVKEICFKQNEIRKARVEEKPVDSLVKSLQEIMKNSALTPALQNAASSGKNAEAFGMWIKDIETLTPAEWYQDQEKYKDIEGMGEYIERYITRPIKNFVTGSRDFNTGDLEEISEMGSDDDTLDLGNEGE